MAVGDDLGFGEVAYAWMDLVLASVCKLSDFSREQFTMELLITYDDEAEAEAAAKVLIGEKRLASDRDDNEVIYRLFGEPTWTNFFKLGMYDLPILKKTSL